jgi:hypothetical protein
MKGVRGDDDKHLRHEPTSTVGGPVHRGRKVIRCGNSGFRSLTKVSKKSLTSLWHYHIGGAYSTLLLQTTFEVLLEFLNTIIDCFSKFL